MTDLMMRSKMTRARTMLLLSQPFFGSLALRLQLCENNAQQTMATDGRSIQYNSTWVGERTIEEVAGVIAHETMHAACGHVWRRDERDPSRFNVAADYAINPLILAAGLTLPEGRLIDKTFIGLSAEAIYALLPQSAPDDAAELLGGIGEDLLPGSVDNRSTTEQQADWKIALSQAANTARAFGKLPDEIERFVGELTRPRVDWRSVLHHFVQQTARADYSWRRPNARYLASGVYAPALRSEQMPPMVIAVDTSGSISPDLLKAFGGEVSAVLAQCRPEMCHVVYCDAQINASEVYAPGDDVELRAVGGGGTDFRPVFAWIEEHGIEPACVVYLTDTEGTFPEEAPLYSVLWASTKLSASVPWGETVYLGD